MIDNPYYCINCNNTYNEKKGDVSSHLFRDYSRYLGFCGDECFDELPWDMQHNNITLAYEKGDILKRRHKFYHKNLPKFRILHSPRPRKKKIQIDI